MDTSYKLLERVLKEQCNLSDDGKAVRFCAALKAIGVNLFRAANKRKAPHGGALPELLHVIYVVKEYFFDAWKQQKKFKLYPSAIMSINS